MYFKIFIIIIFIFLFYSETYCDEPVLIRESTNIFWNQNSAALDDGVVYCWTDTKDSKWNVYTQKVDADGNKLWNNGNPLLIDNRNDLIKYFSNIISTSDNCVIIVWQNIQNNNWQDKKLYAQKISSSGETLWPQNTELIVENMDFANFCVVPNNIGGAYIFHLYSGDIYGINLDSNANDLWETNNLPIIENAYLLSTISDNSGGSILSYKDYDNDNLKVIRINFEKEILWNQMIYSAYPFSLNSISVGNDNFIFSWKVGQNIYGQRVDINGNVHWEDNGVVIINENVSPYSKVELSSNDDCFFVMYSTDENEEDSFSLKAQKINMEDSPEWDDSVILEGENTSSYFIIDSHIDDNGGCYFSWLSNSNIISQHLDSEGTKLWGEYGIEIGNGFGSECPQYGIVINKINNDIFCCWLLTKESQSFLSYQCLDQDGQILLPENGVEIRSGLFGYIYNYQTIINDNSSYHIWEDGRYPYYGRIFMQRVSSDGAIYFEDNGLALTDTIFSSQGYVTSKPLPENGIIAAWTEQKENEEFKRVRWQKVNENGNTFSENGVDLTVDIEYEQKKTKIGINDGNIIIAWWENDQIKAQKLVNDEPVWGNNGKVIVENCSIYYFSMIGNYFYWGLDDNRYFIMIDENGNIPVNWPVSGLPLPDFITHLYSMDVIEENLLFSYKSYQNGQRDYGIQILSSNAEYLFNGCGLTLYPDVYLCDLDVFFDGYINFVWRDYDYLNNYILMERFDLQGNSVWDGNICAVESQGNIFRIESEKIGDNLFIVWQGNNEDEDCAFFMQSVDEDGVPFQSNLSGVEFENLSEDHYYYQVSKLTNSKATILYQRGYWEGSEAEYFSTGLVAQTVDVTNLTETIEETIQPCHIFLNQNYPNPFNPSGAGAGRSPTTTISFELNTENTENTEIIIYNIKGQKIKQYSIFNNQYSITWNGTDKNNKPVASGVYMYKLTVNGKTKAVKKCLLLK